ncbi:acyltransferase family protein [Enterobacter huaxiensis]
MTNTQPNQKIYSIHYIRGIASILVILYHFRGNLNGIYAQSNLGDLLFGRGGIGVDLFFVLSGFIIAFSTKKSTGSIDFIFKRVFRIYPVYLACMLLMLTLPSFHLDGNFLKSLFFIHLDYQYTAPVFGYAFIFAAWTLTYEIIFYALFCISQTLSHKYRTIICSLTIVLVVVLLQAIFNDNISFFGNATISPGTDSEPSILKILASPMMIEFVYGMLIFHIYEFLSKHSTAISKMHIKAICVAGITFSIICYMTGYLTYSGPIGAGLIAAILFISVLSIESLYGSFRSNVLNLLGNLSYSMYLSHVFVIRFVQAYGKDIDFIRYTSGFSRIIFMLMLTVLISYVLYHIVEKPFINLGRVLVAKYYTKTKEQVGVVVNNNS